MIEIPIWLLVLLITLATPFALFIVAAILIGLFITVVVIIGLFREDTLLEGEDLE